MCMSYEHDVVSGLGVLAYAAGAAQPCKCQIYMYRCQVCLVTGPVLVRCAHLDEHVKPMMCDTTRAAKICCMSMQNKTAGKP
jgi:hypothetical protein